MNSKEKAIELAYVKLNVDWDWISLFIDFSNGFTFKTDIRLTLPQEELEIINNELGVMWRPKELIGIETNNGWIKIESEKDLPSDEDKKYVAGFLNEKGEFYENEDICSCINLKYLFSLKQITHYQIYIKRNPPIY